MKKHIILLGTILISGAAFSQVGINTEQPKATLDVVASPLENTKIDGVIAPRLTRAELTNKGNSLYGSEQKGAILYITDVSGGDTNTQRLNVTEVGYYYFDGSLWVKFKDKEPWNVQGGVIPATANNQAIYQNNSVAIKKQTGITGVDLDVSGSIRGGSAAITIPDSNDPNNSIPVGVGSNSIAFGYGSRATAQNSVAFGWGAIAERPQSYAIGWNAKVGYTQNLFNGNNEGTSVRPASQGGNLVGRGGYAFGERAIVGHDHAFAIGRDAVAAGQFSTAIGFHSKVAKSFSFAIGYNAKAGIKSDYTEAEAGFQSFAIGRDARTEANFAFAVGYGTTVGNAGGFALGRFNAITTGTTTFTSSDGLEVIPTNTTFTGVATDPLFQLGNGTNNANRSNAVTVLNNGNIGINTITPQRKLHIVNNGPAFQLQDGSEAANYMLVSDSNGVATWKPQPTVPPTLVAGGTSGSGVSIPFAVQLSNQWYHTGGSITLPPGLWKIDLSHLLIGVTQGTNSASYSLPADEYAYVRFTLVETAPGTIGDAVTANPTPDFAKIQADGSITTGFNQYVGTNFSGPVKAGGRNNTTTSGPRKYIVASGSMSLKNSTTSPKTYYIAVQTYRATSNISMDDFQFINVGSSGNGENTIIASPLLN